MNLNEAQLRELDACIAEHVMLYKRGHPGGCIKEYWQPPPYNFGVIPVEKLPKFTTDPAAAFAVLEKCAIRLGEMPRFTHHNGGWIYTDPKTRVNSDLVPTLQLCICLFARALFTPSGSGK